MSAAWIVFAKEVKDNLRDRRAVTLALFMPILAPALSSVALIFGAREELKAWKEPLELPVSGAEHAPDLVDYLRAHGVNAKPPPADADTAVRSEAADAVLIIREGFVASMRAGDPAELTLVIDEGRRASDRAKRRVKAVIDGYGATISSVRLLARGVDPALLTPIAVEVRDLGTKEARFAMLLASLPMFLVLAVFVSGVYVAIDVTAGERERGSLEALLLNPVSRSALAIGKLLAVTVFAWLGLLCTVLGFIAVPLLMPADLGDVPLRLDPRTLMRMWLILLPLGLLASSVSVLIGTLAKGFREAQASLSYISLLPMVPGMVVAFSSPQPSLPLMLVPVFSEQLLMNAWLKGADVPLAYVLTSIAVTSSLAAALVYATVRRFNSDRFL